MKKKSWYQHTYNECPRCKEKELIKKQRVTDEQVDINLKVLMFYKVCGACKDNDWIANTMV